MSLRFWCFSSTFLITLLVNSSHEKHLGFFFSNFNFKFEPTFMNLSIDMSIYNKSTKRNPVYLVPEAKIQIYEDIPRLHVQLLAHDMKSQKILANRTIDFCEIDTLVHSNIFFHSLLHHLLDNIGFPLKCPFKKGTYIIKEHLMPNYAVPLLMKVKDKFMNVQKVKTKVGNHIKTVFESSYTTEVCEFN